MIPVDSLLYKIDQKLNKLSTNEHQQINLEDKILALNEAQIKLIKQKVDGTSTNSGLGLDAFKKRYEDLQSLVVNYQDGKLPLALKNVELNQWTLSHYNEPYFMNPGMNNDESQTRFTTRRLQRPPRARQHLQLLRVAT